MKNGVNIKGLVWFLSLTFIPTIIVSFVAKHFTAASDFGLNSNLDISKQLILAGAMFFPLIAAVITQKYILKKKLKEFGFRLGPKKLYFKTFFLIVFLYFVIYSLTWVFVDSPDLSLNIFMSQYGLELPMSANRLILILFLATLFITPLINILPSLGEELGWRGFLLNELLPLGRKKALIISGFIWALWHLPFVLLIGFGYGQYSLLGAPLFIVLITVVGIWFGYLRLISNSIWLPTFAHAVFNAQGYGVWIVLWPSINPLIGGKVGVFALIIYIIVSLIILKKIKKKDSLEIIKR